MSLTKDISKFFKKASKRRDLSDQSKTCEDSRKIREDKSSTGSLTDMPDDIFRNFFQLIKKCGGANKGYLHISRLNTRS